MTQGSADKGNRCQVKVAPDIDEQCQVKEAPMRKKVSG